MSVNEMGMRIVQRDWGGVPVALERKGSELAARSQSGRDLLARFAELRAELEVLPGDWSLSGLLYLYAGWTRQPPALAREVVVGRRVREGLAPRIDVLDSAGAGDAWERWQAVRELLAGHDGLCLRPAMTQLLPAGECELLARAGTGHLLLRPARGEGEEERIACRSSGCLRVGAWWVETLGDGLLALELLDGQGRSYLRAEGFGAEVFAPRGVRSELYGAARGTPEAWRLPGLPGTWRAADGAYRIEIEEEEFHEEY